MDIDENSPGVPLPRFLDPTSDLNPPWPPEGSPPPLSPETDTGRSGSTSPRLGRDGTRTGTSSLGDVKKPDPAQAAALMVGLLGLAVAGAGWLVRQKTKRKLRQPTKRQTNDVAEPLGRILLRHVDLTLFGPDITDLIAAGAGVGAYLNDGDLLLGPATESGLPAGLNSPEDQS